MSDLRAFGQLEGRVAALESRMEDVEERIDNRLSKIEGSLDKLAAAFNMGQGARWAAAKFGAALLVTAAALGWIWDHFVSPFMGKH